MDDTPPDHGPAPEEPATPVPSSVTSRRMLMLGAVGASSVVAIRPALAQATASILACQIPVPDPGNAGKYIASDGSLAPPSLLGPITGYGPFPPPSRPFTGDEVQKAMFQGQNLPGATSKATQAYLAYIRKLKMGQSGYTCFLSVQNPRT
ncbi:hypothetical protein [uncultured Sphingomonas sp.]|uniref:hypothetical protein n=1 Tax=uncultured Sphingomonas sp. TaxID=158754 RepID=UPI0025F3B91B|nr:hypothetical protein [uncultured Sphingomonas sp.]